MTAQELKDKYDADLAALQESCKHEDKTGWLPYCWAPAHFNGKCISCNTCWKILEHAPDMIIDWPQATITYNGPE